MANGYRVRQLVVVDSRVKVRFQVTLLISLMEPAIREILEKYWTNPQYLVRLNFIDDGDDENLCTMIIALMQKETRQRRIRGLEGEDYVQFRVFKVSD